jgi:23S rRNA (guanosine2251-2'-O)-methyltransferase
MTKKSPDRLRTGSFKQKKFRSNSPKDTAQVIWGIHPILEALEISPHIIREIILDKKKSGIKTQKLVTLADRKKVPLRYAKIDGSKDMLWKGDPFDQERHQGVIAHIILPILSLQELLADLKHSENVPLILALDSIQDPHNLGAIIRSAVAVGVNKLILPKDRSASITGTVVKASAGGVFHLDVCRVTNLVSTIGALKDEGIWVFGTSKDASQTIHDADFSVPACLVIGNEEKGLRPLVKKHCDMLVTIPMQGKLDSLNASVAAGVILFEIARQRASKL